MSLPVVLKSGKNYMTVVLDDSMEFGELLSHIVNKFKEAERFFGNESFAITIEGRELSDRESNIIMDAIEEYTTINITHLIENSVIKEALAEKESYEEEHLIHDKKENNCLFINRDVMMREKIFGSGSVVVNGNVSEGAIIKAGGSIIVLGALMGQALAGNDPEIKDAFIKADDFCPENFRIGSIVGNIPKRKKSAFKKHKISPRIAEFIDGEIQLKAF